MYMCIDNTIDKFSETMRSQNGMHMDNLKLVRRLNDIYWLPIF